MTRTEFLNAVAKELGYPAIDLGAHYVDATLRVAADLFEFSECPDANRCYERVKEELLALTRPNPPGGKREE